MSICGHFSPAILYFDFLFYINYLGLPFFPPPTSQTSLFRRLGLRLIQFLILVLLLNHFLLARLADFID